MCRAVWVYVAAATDDECKKLRRACGAEAQVVGMSTEANASDVEASKADVVVLGEGLDALAAPARELGKAVVWVGTGTPEAAHDSVPNDEMLGDALPSAITKALIARRSS